jgi:hypothetical protein
MKRYLAAAALIALAGAADAGTGFIDGVLQAGDGSAGNAYDFGSLSATPEVLYVSLNGNVGSSFEEYANFTIDAAADVNGSANTYALTFGRTDVLRIDDLKIEVWDNTHPNGDTLFATFSGDNVTTWLGTLGAGQYHIDISGSFGPEAAYGQYSVAMNAVPAVPEPETYALMLAGLGAVAFMARRRRQQA